MSKRPSFQFYPADWSANPNLKRCTFAEKGIWLEVMCLLHDQLEYGVLRWSLQEIATAVKCRVADLRALHRKGVLKGDDEALQDPFVYVPRSGRKDGAPVELVPAQAGPIWFSSRMVKDEYVRGLRADGGTGGEGNRPAPKGSPKGSPDASPKPPFGEAFGPRTSSSPSSEEGSEDKSSGAEGADPDLDATAWQTAVVVLTKQGGLTEPTSRRLFGKLLSTNGLEARDLLPALSGAMVNKTRDPQSYLSRSAESIAKRRTPAQARADWV